MRGEKQMNRKEKKAVGLLKALNNLEKKCKIEKVPYKSEIKKIMISLLPEDYGIFEILLNLIDKLQKENEELKEDRKNNNEMIALAQNELLNYMSGYEDGKKHKMTAMAQVIENQQYYIVRKQMEKYEEHIKRLQKENEELKNQEATQRKINELLVQRYSNSISVQKVKAIIDRIDYDIKKTKEIISNNSNIYTSDRKNDYQIVRLKAMNTKSLDIKKRLQELLESEK